MLQGSQELMSFDELMYDVLKFINDSTQVLKRDGVVELAAMDIGCGYHSHMRSIRRWWTKKVCMASYKYEVSYVYNRLNSVIVVTYTASYLAS